MENSMRLRRNTTAWRAAGATILLAGALAASAIAGPGFPDNQYEGRAEGDSGTYVGFDVVNNNGNRKVRAVSAFLTYRCQGGGGGEAFVRAEGGIKVNDEGRFRGTVRTDEVPVRQALARRGDLTEATYLFKGRLKSGGRARGRIDGNLFFSGMPRGESQRCYTGELDWAARRGAEVEPVFGP
jgi:hypothetical protein